MNYKYFVVSIEIVSPISTPLLADTIWGHICWGIKYYESEESLKKFLKTYETKTPELIISDAFFKNSLPVPMLTPFISEKLTKEQMKELKSKKKLKYISKDIFLTGNKISINSLKPIDFKIIKTERLKNTINRLTNTTRENGGLYEVEEIWFKDKDNVFEIYVISYLDKKEIFKYFNYGFSIGFGKDASTGKGIINVIDVKEINFPQSGKRAMALANFVPSEQDNIRDLYAEVFTKYGKLGGEFAINSNPFKKPIVMFKTGATFSLEEKKFFVGTLLSDIHKNPDIKHYAFAPIIYFEEEVV